MIQYMCIASLLLARKSTSTYACTLLPYTESKKNGYHDDMINKLDLSIQSHSEQFSSNAVTVTLEWTLLNSQSYYQRLLRNVTVTANPQLNNVMPTGNMRVQLTLLYNTVYNVNVTQHSTCRLLIRTPVFELNFSKQQNTIILKGVDNRGAWGAEPPSSPPPPKIFNIIL
jgi:hypothetical protein